MHSVHPLFSNLCINVFLWFSRFVVSIRDLLSWVNFINTCSLSTNHDDMDVNVDDKVLLSPALAYVHGACLVFLDALGSGLTSFTSSSSTSSSSSPSRSAVKEAYQACLEFLRRQVRQDEETESCSQGSIDATSNRTDVFGISPFFIPRGI